MEPCQDKKNIQSLDNKRQNMLMYWIYRICNQYLKSIIQNSIMVTYLYGGLFEKEINLECLNVNSKWFRPAGIDISYNIHWKMSRVHKHITIFVLAVTNNIEISKRLGKKYSSSANFEVLFPIIIDFGIHITNTYN